MEEVAHIIPHIFLTIKLPNGQSEEEVVHWDTCILRAFFSWLFEQNFHGRPFPNTIRSFHVWEEIQDCRDDERLSQKLAGLKPGDSLPIYLRAQNAGLLATLSDAGCDDHPAGSVVMSTFAASQKAVDVTSAESDLIGSYPTTSIHVPSSPLLTSRLLARQIIALNESVLSDAMPKRPKSNNWYDDERDVADPKFVSKWLCGLLCDRESCSCTAIPLVVKKARDEVLFGRHDSLPFRRSGMWMTIKVVLQILLVKELGEDAGRQTYKMILLKFMCSLSACESMTADIGVQVMAKIARRWYKLYGMEDAMDQESKELLSDVGEDVKTRLESLRKRLEDKWKAEVNMDSMEAKLPMSGNFDFYKDSKHRLNSLVSYLKLRIPSKAGNSQAVDGSTANVKTPSLELSLAKLSTVPFAEPVTFSSQGKQALENLFCFEFIILQNLHDNPPEDYAVACSTFISYLRAAKTAYRDDQVGHSRAILVCLKILQWLDQLVCGLYPLMRDHKIGIPIKIIEHLMLPFSSDLKLAHDLEMYFAKRELATHPNLLDPNPSKFEYQYSVRHAEQDSDMQSKRLEIIEEGIRRAAEKVDEVRKERRNWELLLSEIQGLSCKCRYIGLDRYRIMCTKCNLKSRADNMEVSIYEKPLPPRTELQNAIVFELLIPEPICYFREMLLEFLNHIGVLNHGERCGAIWSDELCTHALSHARNLTVRIGSKSSPQNRYYPRSLHPSDDPSQFVIENACNVRLYNGDKEIEPHCDVPEKILRLFVFKTESESPYADLQWALEDHDFKFSDNQILAKQNECPSTISLTEFKEFGSIRAGHRIQLRNLFRALKQGTLSLRTESVLSLIYQVLWRAGPPTEDSSCPAYVRQSHVDLLNIGFVKEFLSLLGSLISSSSENWDDHNTYAAITVILLRIFSISEDNGILNKCFALLQHCRRILRKWCTIIEKELDAMENQPVAEQTEMRKKLVAVAILCTSTYWSDHRCCSKDYLRADVQPWLLCVKTIQEYLGEEDFLSVCSNMFQNQLRRMRECGIVNLEQFLKFIKADPGILQAFTANVWSGNSRCNSSAEWKCFKNDTQWFEANVLVDDCHTVLQADILDGHFLVNGKPEDYLPIELKNHADYKRLFRNFIIKVQPVTHLPWAAMSKHPFQGEKMRFVENLNSSTNRTNPYIISAISTCEEELEYVPENALTENASRYCFQEFLVRKHTHWWSTQRHQIYFRSRESHKINFTLNLDTGQIEESGTGRRPIDNASTTFHQMMKIFTRLEQEDYIEVYLLPQRSCDEQAMLDVQLPRMRLNFRVTCGSSNLDVSSVEYPGMRVAKDQRCGTLVGLKSCLILEPAGELSRFSNNLLLIPHGTVNLPDASSHVLINTKTLRSPPYFAYEVDSTLLQLKCGNAISAVVYLAYLHALTSRPLPDPLTLQTGTEMATQLLQLGLCWSPEPYDGEAAETLMLISKISPVRKYNSKRQVMTAASWPLVRSLSCSDAFRIIVDKLISDSHRLPDLFEAKLVAKHDTGGDRILQNKSYWRYFQCSAMQAHISTDFLYLNPPIMRQNSKFDCNFDDQVMPTILKLVLLIDTWNTVPYCGRNLHETLVNGRTSLRGHFDPFPVVTTIAEWQILEFVDSWLRLFVLAKNVRCRNLMEEWKMILSSYAFLGIPEAHLVLLHTIAVRSELFATLHPPNCALYHDPCQTMFDRTKIRSLIQSKTSEDFNSFSRQQQCKVWHWDDYSDCQKKQVFENLKNDQIDGLLSSLQNTDWPFRSCFSIVYGYRGDRSLLDLNGIVNCVDIQLNSWSDNYELKQFIMQVEKKVLEIGSCLPFHDFDPRVVCQKLSLNTPSGNSCVKKTFVQFSIHGDQRAEESSDACQEAGDTFRKGYIGDIQLWSTICSDSEDEICTSVIAAKITDPDILSDPSNGTCAIWCHLVDGLAVERLPTKSVRKHLSSKNSGSLVKRLEHLYSLCDAEQRRFWSQAHTMVVSDPLIKVLVTAGIYQRLTPLTLLPLISRDESTLPDFQNCLRNVLGGFGVAETCKRRALRCLKYLRNNSRFELERELCNVPHDGWSPAEKPEWLLLEIELDMLVRPKQKRVAERMENPKDGKNAVLQLNMGEGKTAVITPLLVLSLTNKKHLCRVTVLKSLFNTNRQTLRLNLGGFLLNRRVYSFPCRRDFPMNIQLVQTLFEVYKECMIKGGVIVTTPEYRLSFQLKTYEQCQSGQHQVAKVLLQVQDWLKWNARDILDESDEILHVNYQLVYALGVQLPPVGGFNRWTVLQRLLNHVPEVIRSIAATSAGKGCVQIIEDASGNGSFPCCRLLKMDIYKRFCGMLVDRILSGTEFPNLQEGDKKLLRRFLTESDIDNGIIERVYKLLSSDSGSFFLDKALIIRGLMACSVLFTTLSKRWRVNYGVSPNCRSLLAVPFRAKDVAAERTEFGHVDVALVLTHLSYYYSGLSESQVSECLLHVVKGPNPDIEYGGWISTIQNPDPSITSLRGMNVENALWRNEKLFPALRKNKAVIDFWLGNIMLPVTVKQFPSKITSTAWDLASDHAGSHPTTGFSGTNDTQLLLPLTIVQNDIPELKLTNSEVFQTLLLEENNGYESLPSEAVSLDILQKLVDSDIPLLLDVGALMLDLDNKAVASAWLDLLDKDDKKAALYFNANDRLMVMDRSALDPVPFEISPFRSMLEKCVIYLDDVHTRGTDLKIPAGVQGCVTLGKGVTKDKLVQGCMRLRKLGKDHTVCFLASDEVNNEIKTMAKANQKLGSAEVLRWALNNSRNKMQDGFPYWVAAACNYLSKTSAQTRYAASGKADSDRILLANEVAVEEVTGLKEMYGNQCCKECFPKVAAQQLQKYCDHDGLRDVRDRVIEHCSTYVPDLKRNIHLLDEEQERELEQEQEEEREVERPGAAKPCIPVLDMAMVQFLKSDHKVLSLRNLPDWALPLPDGLKYTRLAEYNETSAWGNGLLVTKDFVNTVETEHPQDSYLRTVNWIVSFSAGNSQFWLLMSPFEVNALIKMFRSQNIKASLHMYAARLSSMQSTLLELDNLVLPVAVTPPLMEIPGFYNLNASLCIFAGCTFFQNFSEFESYCAITGYVPKPRSPEVEQALCNANMDNTGFLLPPGCQILRPNCHFQKNPERLIVGIIMCRYTHFSSLCHVAKLVHECSKPTFDNN